jgi:hypothetical protein
VCFEDLASTPSNAQSDTLPAWPAMKSAGEIEAGGDLSRKKPKILMVYSNSFCFLHDDIPPSTPKLLH